MAGINGGAAMSNLEKSLADIAAEQQSQDAAYFSDPVSDALLKELLAMTEEACVLSDRLDTAMRLSAAGLVVDEEAIDAFEADDDLQAQRLAQHHERFRALFARIAEVGP